jgi:hypothetical protein
LNAILSELHDITEKTKTFHGRFDKNDSQLDPPEYLVTSTVDQILDQYAKVKSKVVQYGILEHSSVVVGRDEFSSSARNLGVAIFNWSNNDSQSEASAIALQKIALEAAGTQIQKDKLRQDLKTIEEIQEKREKFKRKQAATKEENERVDSILSKVVELIQNGKTDEAQQYITSQKSKAENNSILEQLDELLDLCVQRKLSEMENRRLEGVFVKIKHFIESNQIKSAIDLIDSELKQTSDEDVISELKDARQHCVERMFLDGSKPISRAPSMRTVNGFGTTLYGQSICFCILFIPIFWTGRYIVTKAGERYRFHGKRKLARWQIAWNLIVVGAIAALIVMGLSNSSSGNSSSSSSSSHSGSSSSPTTKSTPRTVNTGNYDVKSNSVNICRVGEDYTDCFNKIVDNYNQNCANHPLSISGGSTCNQRDTAIEKMRLDVDSCGYGCVTAEGFNFSTLVSSPETKTEYE